MAQRLIHVHSDFIEDFVIKRYDSIEKSVEDKREYRGLELKNHLKVLLVSDPLTDKSAAGIDVNIGFLSDPDYLPGLAHFCEHMLFLGTAKYPEENTYNKFLNEHGGSSNACTTSDHTYYFFDVLPEHLSATLDIFSEFFMSPLFTPESTDRELLAINSEHDKNVCSDIWRLDQLNRHIADPMHPHNKFGTGNKTTLEIIPKEKGINVRKELLDFHSKWYSSNIMSLVIFGKETLNDLEKMAIEKFSNIKDKNVELPTWISPYTKEFLGLKINATPIKDIRHLHVNFPIPDSRQFYKSAPVHYISHLIGHEGPKSLLSVLKHKGWCNSLSSGAQHGGRGFALFDISVDLTENGINHVDDIIELIFQYIHLLKQDGVQKWIFDEISNMSATNFRFKDREEPTVFVTSNVHDIQQYPMENILTAHYYLTEWNANLINSYLEHLVPENLRIAVIAKSLNPKCDLTEKWYSTQYSIEKIPEELMTKWRNCGLTSDLALPLENCFLPDNFDIIPLDSKATQYPTIIYDSPIMRIWYKQDDEYLLPKLNCFFDFVSPLAYSDPLNTNLNAVFALLFQDAVNEYAYAAELAGINYRIYNTKNGLSIQISGFNSKQHILLQSFIDKLMCFKVNPERFQILKEVYIRELQNFEMQQPYEHCTFYLTMMLTEHAWSKKEYLNATEAMTIENLEEFIAKFLRRLHIECLIHGNISKQNAMELGLIVEKRMPQNIIPLLSQQLILSREVQLEKGSHYRLEIDHTVHRNSCILVYYQCGLEDTTSNVLLELFLHIISEPCYNILRTKEQLGYIVYSGIRRNNGVQGLRIIIQSEKHPSYVESRIEAFVNYVMEYISNQSEEEFERHRNSLIAQKLKRPKMLLGLSFMYKIELVSQQYNFDRVNIEVKALKQINKKQLIDFYKEAISIESHNRQKLSVHVISTAKGGAGNSDTEKDLLYSNNIPDIEILPAPEDLSKVLNISDVVTFKSSHSLFPLVTPYINIPRKGTHCKL